MPGKKKTLPNNFKDLIEAKDAAALKAVFEACELNATNGYDKHTALHFYDVPADLVRWLAEQGADLNARERYGRAPLDRHATIGSGILDVLLELGADAQVKDNYGNTPLHAAAGFHRVSSVRSLIAHGADIQAENDSGQTPLAYALARCQNADIAGMAPIAETLLEAGAKITPDMAEAVERIGRAFEFHRAGFNPDYLAETDAGLARLYELFHAAPVAKRRMHDGVSPISVPEGAWHEQHEALWQALVPGRGSAEAVQGEAIRVSGRLAHELMDNGGANWDRDFRKMLSALIEYFNSGRPLPADELSEAAAIAERTKGGDGDGQEPERLMELAVHWVRLNPNPIHLAKPAYRR
jgi:hypothetical protein